jgi:hypothetical protein
MIKHFYTKEITQDVVLTALKIHLSPQWHLYLVMLCDPVISRALPVVVYLLAGSLRPDRSRVRFQTRDILFLQVEGWELG